MTGPSGPLYLQVKGKEVSKRAWQGENPYSPLSNIPLGREARQGTLYSAEVPALAAQLGDTDECPFSAEGLDQVSGFVNMLS